MRLIGIGDVVFSRYGVSDSRTGLDIETSRHGTTVFDGLPERRGGAVEIEGLSCDGRLNRMI
jgi:hypothetical protein